LTILHYITLLGRAALSTTCKLTKLRPWPRTYGLGPVDSMRASFRWAYSWLIRQSWN